MAKKIDPSDRGTESFGGDWSEWANYVLLELKRVNEVQEALWTEINKLRNELKDKPGISLIKKVDDLSIDLAKAVTEMRIKSGLFGAIGALIPIVIFIIYQILKGL